MTAAEWARRKAEGLCGASSACNLPRTHGSYCEAHREVMRAAQARSNKKKYDEKKLAGLCVERGCPNPAPDSLWCPGCHEKNLAQSRARNATKTQKRKMAAWQRARQKKRKRAGICLRCNSPVVTETLCEKHRRELREYHIAKYGTGTRVEHCRGCGERGHRINTCEGLREHAVPAPTIADFASARTPVEM